VGLLQGSPTSPLLAAVTLEPLIREFPGVQYADDGLFAGDLDKYIKEMKSFDLEKLIQLSSLGYNYRTGVKFAPKKTG
jgi:hypothetical protein